MWRTTENTDVIVDIAIVAVAAIDVADEACHQQTAEAAAKHQTTVLAIMTCDRNHNCIKSLHTTYVLIQISAM